MIWNNADEILPNESCLVVIFDPKKGRQFAWFSNDAGFIYRGIVTHWIQIDVPEGYDQEVVGKET